MGRPRERHACKCDDQRDDKQRRGDGERDPNAMATASGRAVVKSPACDAVRRQRLGALLAPWVLHYELNVISMIGIILLIGIVQKNATGDRFGGHNDPGRHRELAFRADRMRAKDP